MSLALAIVKAVPEETAAPTIEFRSDVTVELVRSSAHDSDVLFAARVSTQGEQTLEAAQGSEDTDAEDKRARGLINYLMRDRHGSPFEHNSMTFYVQAPIFVFREFMRHRIASYNEESGRYRELKPVFYVPAPERNLVQVGSPVPMTSCPAHRNRPRSCRRRRASNRLRPSRATSGCSRQASPARWRASCSR